MAKITPRRIYRVADDLYSIKDKLEKYLCHKTDDLFKPTNRIMLFDLTNFYFEGRKTGQQEGCLWPFKGETQRLQAVSSRYASILTASYVTVRYWKAIPPIQSHFPTWWTSLLLRIRPNVPITRGVLVGH